MSYRKLASLLGVLCLVPTPLLAQAKLETFVIATTGQKTNSTGGPVAPINNNFGNFVAVPSNATSDSSQLATVGVSGLFRTTTATGSGPLSDTASISGSGRSSFGNWSYNGNTSASVRPGIIKTTSQAFHNGNSDNATINNAASYGIFNETLRATSGTVGAGSRGTMRIAMTIDGNMMLTGTGTIGMIFRYDYGDPRPGYPAINQSLVETFAYTYGNGYAIYGPHSYLGTYKTPSGMSYTVGPVNAMNQPSFISFAGTATVYADIPITFGQDTEFRMGMLTFTGVGNGNGTMDVQYGNTAKMTGIQLFDSRGNAVNDFSLTSGSGAQYDAAGVHFSAAAPEPASLALVVTCGMVLLLRARGRRYRAIPVVPLNI